MNIISTEIPDILQIIPDLYEDQRGYFMELFREEWFKNHSSADYSSFVQDNLSSSQKGTVRGLHYQIRHIQAKLVTVLQGEILDVAVDLRKDSPTFGTSITKILSSENRIQLYIPEGFAHGFSVLSDHALVYYKCSNYYDKEAERGLNWTDPDIDIDWKVDEPVLSDKDRYLPYLKDIPEEDLF